MKDGSGLSYDRYMNDREWLTRVGSADARPILFLPPLFEEMNRTRALVIAAMRGLAERGFGCWLPDLPGTGESERPLEFCHWEDWREAAHAAAEHVGERSGQAVVVASLRGGCLLDDNLGASRHWRFAPVEGTSLNRDLARSGLVGGGNSAGYEPCPELMAALGTASPAPVAPLRTVRLASDRADADAKLAGPALWRRSEPGTSSELSDAIASDITKWLDGACVAS